MYFAPSSQTDDPWTRRVYAGEIARWGSLAAFSELVAWVQRFCASRWPSPPEMHRAAAPEELERQIAQAQRAFMADAEVARLWGRVFEEAGLASEDTCRDRLMLRIQPPLPDTDDGPVSLYTSPLPFHRDTWASNIYPQINWWAPVYQLAEGRTMTIHPGLWDRPIVNSSREFDMNIARQRVRTAPNDLRVCDVLPIATETVDREEAISVLIDPGEVIAFSGQHAHASIPNRTPLTRISLDTRTVSIRDLAAGAGAPNIDGMASGVIYDLFRRLSDRASLSEIVARW